MRTQRSNGSTIYNYTYYGSQLTHMTYGSNSMHFYYDASGKPLSVVYNGTTYYYILSLQGDVVAILNSSGVSVVEYTYDAWGRLLTTTGSMSGTLGLHNPLRYRSYVYDRETGLYYLQSRYYNPAICRFISADTFVSTGQGILGYNMFAYCANNPIAYTDPAGYLPDSQFSYKCLGAGGGRGANTELLMAFFGVTSPNEIPKMPDGAMIFVENTTGITILGLTFIRGSTIVFDEYKYCEYSFTGIGIGAGLSLPLDKTITQGYVYGVNDVADYCGEFWGGSLCCAATAIGGAFAFGGVRGEITAGTSTSVSLSASRTYYITSQTGWIYGRANLTFITVPTSPPSYLPGRGSAIA